jgi:hypothetical protein
MHILRWHTRDEGGQVKCVYNIINQNTSVDALRSKSKTLPELPTFSSNKSEGFEPVRANLISAMSKVSAAETRLVRRSI